VLIPSLYAINPRTRSLRPVRVPSDQNTRWRLPFHFPLIKDKNFLSSHICQIDIYILDLKWDHISPRRRTRATLGSTTLAISMFRQAISITCHSEDVR
jgi:hypothetical protein